MAKTPPTDHALRSRVESESATQCSGVFGVGLRRNQESPGLEEIINQLRLVRSYRQHTHFRKDMSHYTSPSVKIKLDDDTFEDAKIFIHGGSITITNSGERWEFRGNFKGSTAKFSPSAPAVDKVGTRFQVEFAAEGKRCGKGAKDADEDVTIIVEFTSEEVVDAGKLSEAVQKGKEYNASDSD